MKLEKINHDLFDISKRLKSIDRRYDLFFNRKKNRYEIYANGAMQMALPFERLDARALSYARKTRLENLEKIIAEIEEENARLEMEKASKARDKIRLQQTFRRDIQQFQLRLTQAADHFLNFFPALAAVNKFSRYTVGL